MADIPGDLSTTATVTVGSTTDGNLEVVGDHDWYKISLTAGQSITVTINGVTLEDPYLVIHDASGGVLYENDDINTGIVRDSRVAFSAGYSGVYYIDVGAFSEAPGGPGDYAGTYQLVVGTYSPPPLANVDTFANQLTSGYWGGDVHRFDVAQGGTIDVNLTALTADGKFYARAALDLWSDVIGVTFREVTSGGQILFDDNQDGAFTTGSWWNGTIDYSQVNVATDWIAPDGQNLNSYSFQTYIHETGHALGLGHAGDYNGDATYPYDALFQNDAWSTSIMSYFSQQDNTYFQGQGFSYDFAVTPMMVDIAAVQDLYGLSTTTRTGNTTYGYNSNADRSIYHADQFPDVAYAIFDSAGTDTIDFSGYNGTQTINLNPETFSSVNGSTGNLSIGRTVVIENAIGGGGADVLTGNSAANTLDGRGGADTMAGGAGNDTYVVDNAGDSVTEAAGQGTDLVKSSVGFTLGANVENLTLTGAGAIDGTGNGLDNALTGNSGVNKLVGNAGDDTLTGGAGADRMVGGTGNDTYYADSYSDIAVENAGEGTDTVFSSASFRLGANLEKLTLTGASTIWGYGNDGANILTGNSAANKLYGLGGNDSLDGGAGADRLFGGTGNDGYSVDSYSDHAYETAGEGTDSVLAGTNYKLGDNVETLTLTGSASLWAYGNAGANTLTGNSGANKLYGQSGNDVLNGGGGADLLEGGAGMDQLFGGSGNDGFVFRDGDFAGLTTSTCDQVKDFATGDRLRLNYVDADTALSGDQAFAFVGTAAFSHTVGELRYEQIGGNTYVSGDTNGDGAADFLIQLDGLHTLSASDLVL